MKRRFIHPIVHMIDDLGLTRQEFADKCGISVTAVQAFVASVARSKNKNYARTHFRYTYQAIAKGLGITEEELRAICEKEGRTN